MSQFDLILYGATSFVGQIICRRLVEHQQHESFSFAIAGRNAAKLDDLKAQIGEAASQVPVIIADANDQASLEKLCKQTQVILSTVGPYALYGEPLVKACVLNGTHYCDLTGEPQWIAKMLDKYEQQAKTSGARIVHCCGFDSLPSDLGVYFLQQQTQQPYSEVRMRVTKLKGAASGGTVASMLQAIEDMSKDKSLRKKMVNPYVLCPKDHAFSARQRNQHKAHFDKDLFKWTAPFVMAAINTRIVHRTNALMNNPYGTHFLYEEALVTGESIKGEKRAKRMTRGLGLFMLAASFSPIRALMQRFFLPKPGEGPSPEAQEKGSFTCLFTGYQDGKPAQQLTFSGDKDPGYGSTAKMVSQAALCLAKDIDAEVPGGFWTPASLMAEPLRKRLESYAGIEIAPVKD